MTTPNVLADHVLKECFVSHLMSASVVAMLAYPSNCSALCLFVLDLCPRPR